MTMPDSPSGGLPDRYAQAMNEVATAVSIITTRSGSEVLGQTASAVTAVAADPPTLLLCINGRSPLVPAIRSSGQFRVNYLAAGHDDLADTFAGRAHDFSYGDWAADAAVGPRLRDAVATFECQVVEVREFGQQVILFGSVSEAGTSSGAEPLLYLKRTYRRVEELPLSVFPVFPR